MRYPLGQRVTKKTQLFIRGLVISKRVGKSTPDRSIKLDWLPNILLLIENSCIPNKPHFSEKCRNNFTPQNVTSTSERSSMKNLKERIVSSFRPAPTNLKFCENSCCQTHHSRTPNPPYCRLSQNLILSPSKFGLICWVFNFFFSSK